MRALLTDSKANPFAALERYLPYKIGGTSIGCSLPPFVIDESDGLRTLRCSSVFLITGMAGFLESLP
jgi:hypothetical protein